MLTQNLKRLKFIPSKKKRKILKSNENIENYFSLIYGARDMVENVITAWRIEVQQQFADKNVLKRQTARKKLLWE